MLLVGNVDLDGLDDCVCWEPVQEEPTVPMSEAAHTMPETPRSNTSASQTSFPRYLDRTNAHANTDQHVHEVPVPASDMTPAMPGAGSEGHSHMQAYKDWTCQHCRLALPE